MSPRLAVAVLVTITQGCAVVIFAWRGDSANALVFAAMMTPAALQLVTEKQKEQ